MSREFKIRPSLTEKQIAIICHALKDRIANLVMGGDMNSAMFYETVNIKNYLENQLGVSVPITQVGLPVINTAQVSQELAPSESVDLSNNIIGNTALTDQQKYDLLKLRPDSQRTEEENKWFLANGIKLMLAAAQATDKPSADDL